MIGQRDKKNEDDPGFNPFQNLDKSTVLQDTKYFNENNVKPKKCVTVLTKLLCLLHQGEQIGANEATGAFFAVTKLFQMKDPHVRQLVYLVIKEISTVADNVIIVTSSLQKDMTGRDEEFRGPAIRALCSFFDTNMMQAIERHMKQAIVDRNHEVACAVLVSSIHMCATSGGVEVVKKWVNEIQEALDSDNVMVQYHALGLIYEVKKQDRLAVCKLIKKLMKQLPRSSLACLQLIRIIAKIIDEGDQPDENRMYDLLEHCLRHKSEMVTLEAAKCIVNLKKTTAKDLNVAVSTLQMFLTSSKPVHKFAAVKTLNMIAMKHPEVVMSCNMDLENLISDSNRSIATLAITTLLKTGSENSIDRLMKQIKLFINDISDEFKIVVVHAIKALCIKFPRKYSLMMDFLMMSLKDGTGLEFKRANVDAFIEIMEEVPESKEQGFRNLSEYMEDCDQPQLAPRIVHLLGQEGPKLSNPAFYIRYIYNRVVVEKNVELRASAVTTLAKFGARCESLRPSILTLLKRCALDDDDEVRDRAVFYHSLLAMNDQALNSQYIVNPHTANPTALEQSLNTYSTAPPTDEPFDFKAVPAVTTLVATKPSRPVAAIVAGVVPSATADARKDTPEAKKGESTHDKIVDRLMQVPELKNVGQLLRSTFATPNELTDAGTEYVVTCVKHIFEHYAVYDFACKNTISDQLLEKVRVEMTPASPDQGHEYVTTVMIDKLPYDEIGHCYVLMRLPEDPFMVPNASFSCTMKFVAKDCDPSTGVPDTEDGFADEYALEDVDLSVADLCSKQLKTNFDAAWAELDDQFESEETFALPINTLDDAINKVIEFLGLQPCERSDRIASDQKASATSHMLLLSGSYRGKHDILVKAKMLLKDGVTMKLTTRSNDEVAAQIICSAIA